MDYLFAYGSLLSRYSRLHYSGIDSPVQSARIRGWLRAWCVSYPDEGATYAGVLQDDAGQLDGILIPSEIDAVLIERERGYQFIEVEHGQIVFNNESSGLNLGDRVFICKTLEFKRPTAENPLPQSYVDTCLIGCIESYGVESANRFIQQTLGWNCIWVNDRHLSGNPIYPRYTPISEQQAQLIDSLLKKEGVIKFRQH